jgi:hypothetical protein
MENFYDFATHNIFKNVLLYFMQSQSLAKIKDNMDYEI